MKTNARGLFRWLVLLGMLLLRAGPAAAQWVTQDQVLTAGWNAIYLTVQPEPAACDAWFTSTNIEQVTAYNDVFSPVQFTVDVGQLTPSGPDWLKWYPTNSPLFAVRNLFTLHAGKAYLVKLAAGAPATTVRFKGRPVLEPRTWREDRFNLTGFLIDTSNVPTFAQFFGPSPQHAGQPIYRLTGSTNWVLTSSNSLMKSGEAFWVRVNGVSDYQGPLAVATDVRAGLDFGSTLTELAITVRNVSGSNRTVSVKLLSSEAPPVTAAAPWRAGEVPLSWWDSSLSSLGAWRHFPSNGFSRIDVAVADDAELALRFAARRRDLTPFTPPPGDVGHYGSILEVTDARGARVLVPVSAEGLVLPGESGTVRSSNAGLWVGDAVIDKVSQPIAFDTQAAHNPSNPVPVGAGAEYEFRILWHLSTNGVANLLPEVNVMWKPGTYSNTPGGLATVGVPGRYVLVARPDLVASFVASTLVGGQSAGRRISSTAVAGRLPVAMQQGAGTATNTFTCTLQLAYNDPVNPFVHRYHPSHNNLAPDGIYQTTEVNSFGDAHTLESYTVTRHVEMAFTPRDDAGGEWGDTMLGGTWRETITGLRNELVVCEGSFLLHKVSDVGVLNDGL